MECNLSRAVAPHERSFTLLPLVGPFRWLKEVQDKMAWVTDAGDVEAIREQAAGFDRQIAEHLLAVRLAA